jgi:hypothetical protein
MNRYETSNPRFAFGMAAVAMTAITIGVSVVLPARLDSNGPEPRIVAAAVDTPLTTGVVSIAAATVTAPSTREVTDAAGADVVALHDAGPSTARCAWKAKTRAHRPALAAS